MTTKEFLDVVAAWPFLIKIIISFVAGGLAGFIGGLIANTVDLKKKDQNRCIRFCLIMFIFLISAVILKLVSPQSLRDPGGADLFGAWSVSLMFSFFLTRLWGRRA